MKEHRTHDVARASRPARATDASAHTEDIVMPLIQRVREDAPSLPAVVTMLTHHVTPVIRDFVRRRVARMGQPNVSTDDVVQDTLIRMTHGVRGCRATTEREAMGWILAIARSALADELRHAGPTHECIDDGAFDGETPLTFEESVGRRPVATAGVEVLLRVLIELTRGLPPHDGTLLWMRVVAEEEWASIGAALGISATAARRRFQRAQGALRRNVHRKLLTLPADEQRLALAWLHKHLDLTLDANDDLVVHDSRD